VSEPQLFMRLPELSDLPPAPPHEPRYAFSPGNGVEATYVVVSPAGVAATASARRLPGHYPEAGYVHYVGARVSDRGRRLGELVTRRVLVHFVAAGLDQAVLETDDFRLPAVRTYLRLGFVPEPRTPGDARRWSKVLRNLARTGEGAAKVPDTAAGARSRQRL
jgi:ribosomal protein S18 acetylase RimI-like enzyme